MTCTLWGQEGSWIVSSWRLGWRRAEIQQWDVTGVSGEGQGGFGGISTKCCAQESALRLQTFLELLLFEGGGMLRLLRRCRQKKVWLLHDCCVLIGFNFCKAFDEK